MILPTLPSLLPVFSIHPLASLFLNFFLKKIAYFNFIITGFTVQRVKISTNNKQGEKPCYSLKVQTQAITNNQISRRQSHLHGVQDFSQVHNKQSRLSQEIRNKVNSSLSGNLQRFNCNQLIFPLVDNIKHMVQVEITTLVITRPLIDHFLPCIHWT